MNQSSPRPVRAARPLADPRWTVLTFTLLFAASGCTTCPKRDYDETGWLARFSDPTPGVESCVGFPDKFGRFRTVSYAFRSDRMLALVGDFAVARYENYTFDFFDADGERMGDETVTLDDDHPANPTNLRAFPGECHPAKVAAPASPLPDACSPRAFGILVVAAAEVSSVHAAHPHYSIVGVPAGTTKLLVTRRTYLEDDAHAIDPPEPLWCDLGMSQCTPLADVVPPVRRRITLDDGAGAEPLVPTPQDPCFGRAQGRCDEPVPMYRVRTDRAGDNDSTHYLGANLSRLGANDLVVFTQGAVPSAASQYPAAARTANEDVRYLSFCNTYRELGTTFHCIHDGEGTGPPVHRVVVGPVGRVVVDPLDSQTKPFEEAVRARGDGFLMWGDRPSLLGRSVLYRNTFSRPGFQGNLEQVPPCDPGSPEACVPASAPAPDGVGAWAPLGRHCTVDEYLAGDDACGAL